MNIGPRVWKTGLSVTITLWITELLNLEYTYLAAVAAIISLQPTINDSLAKGWERIQATAIGVIISLSIMFFLGNSPVVIGLGVIITILICLKYDLHESVVLASLTVAIIMAGSRDDTFSYALQRATILPFIGILVAVIINKLLSPPSHKETLKKSLRDLNDGIEMFMMKVTNNFLTCQEYNTNDLTQLSNKIYTLYDSAKQNMTMYKNEHGGHIKHFINKQPKEIQELEQILEILWLIAQRALNIERLTQERCSRLKKINNPSNEYSELLKSVQDFLLLTSSLEKNLLEEFLDPDENLTKIINHQIQELTNLREDLRTHMNKWQESHLGSTHIRSLIEIATLINDLDQVCNHLFKLRTLKQDTNIESKAIDT